ncbi:MAG: hypothetical protein ACHQVK_00070 [Candidatus Paceibacterales bacterium]
MKEKDLQKIVKAKLIADGYVYWFPPRTWGERDIMGVFDFMAAKGNKVIFVQITTIQHISERVKKIKRFYEQNGLRPFNNVFVWGYRPAKAAWKIERVK